MKKPAVISPELLGLLKTAVYHCEAHDIRHYAIGGAVAMAAHGYARHTGDVDLFVDDKIGEKKFALLASFKKRGFHVSEIFDRLHYVVIPDLSDPDFKIDVLFPYDDPDWSAVMAPTTATLGNLEFNAFPIELLVLSKYYAIDDPQDRADIYNMLKRGMFDPAEARALLEHMDPEQLDEWDALMHEFSSPRVKKNRPKRKS